MQVNVHASTSDTRWQEFVLTHPEARVEHDVAWQGIFAKTYGYQSRYLVAEDGCRMIGVLPLFSAAVWPTGRCLASLPFLDLGGPLTYSPEVSLALLATAAEQAATERAAYLEVRTLAAAPDGVATHVHKAKLVLSLAADTENTWKGLAAKVRNQVRKAQKKGLVSRIDSGESVDAFYRVYSRNMRDLGSPVAARSLFAHSFSHFGGRAKLITVWLGDVPVAGAVWLSFRTTAYVPWASSLRRYFGLCPNNLLYWEAIRLACEAGCGEFDFGRSTVGSGPYRFKLQWGAQPQQLCWQYFFPEGLAARADRTGQRFFRLASWAWRRLPLCAANLLGPHIVARMP